MSHLVLIEARRWLGTPFMAGASVRGVGCDCAGLIEGVARELGLAYPKREAVKHDILQAAVAFMVAVDTPIPVISSCWRVSPAARLCTPQL